MHASYRRERSVRDLDTLDRNEGEILALRPKILTATQFLLNRGGFHTCRPHNFEIFLPPLHLYPQNMQSGASDHWQGFKD